MTNNVFLIFLSPSWYLFNSKTYDPDKSYKPGAYKQFSDPKSSLSLFRQGGI